MRSLGRRVQAILRRERGRYAQIGPQASVLTLATLFALVPLALAIVWFVAHLPAYQEQVTEFLEQFLSILIPEQAIAWRERFSLWQADPMELPMTNVVFLLLAIFFLVNRVDHALHLMLGETRVRGKRRWLHYIWVMPVLLFVLMAGMTALIVLQIVMATGLSRMVPTLYYGSLPLLTLLIYIVYRLASRKHVAIKAALVGAVLASIGLFILKQVFSWLYGALPNWSLVFGVFYAVPLFLLWCQAAWSTVLYGALFSRLLSER